MGEVTKFFWTKINDRTFDFDSRKKIPKLLASVTKDEMVKMYEDIFFKKQKVLELQIISDKHKEQNNTLKAKRLEKEDEKCVVIKDHADFKANSKFHPDYLSLVKNTANQ